MSSASVPEPPDSGSKKLSLDEIIAILVAFAAIGTIAWASVGSSRQGEWTRWLTGSRVEEAPKSVETDDRVSLLPPAGEETAIRRSRRSHSKSRSRDRSLQLLPLLSLTTLNVADPEADSTPSRRLSSPEVPDTEADSTSSRYLNPPDISDTEVEGDATPSDPIEFTDVPDAHWARNFIAALNAREIVTGFPDRTFRPDRPVTRAEFASQLAKIFDDPPERDPFEFTDVSDGFWGKEGIDSAVEMGFMGGYPGRVFRPEQPVRRLEVLVALANGLDLETPEAVESLLESAYQDSENIDDWARSAIATASAGGLVVNHPNRQLLKPQDSATRAEVAAMLYQALIILGQADELPSEFRVTPADWE